MKYILNNVYIQKLCINGAGVAFVPTDKGTIVALNAETGEMLWKYKLSFALVNSIVPVVDAKERKILVTTMDGKVSLLSY